MTNTVKYPRTKHLPWSPGVSRDDLVLVDDALFRKKEVVITEKMDGESTTLYADYLHARSLSYKSHPSRNWIKNLHASISKDIPTDWRICGENVYAQHSVAYTNLSSYFLVFSIWNEKNECLSWEETVTWCSLLGLKHVPVLFSGKYSREILDEIETRMDFNSQEGYVVRNSSMFHFTEFQNNVAKYVRIGHVQTDQHWINKQVIQNKLIHEED